MFVCFSSVMKTNKSESHLDVLSNLLPLCFSCLMGETFSRNSGVKMPADKRPSTGNPKSPKKSRKITFARSVSCEDNLMVPPPPTFRRHGRREERYRAISECVTDKSPKKIVECWEQVARSGSFSSGRFPIQRLPTDCRLKIFSFLTVKEKGVASLVCREWNDLMKTPGLWGTVDLTTFPMCSVKRKNHHCGQLCYKLYRIRIQRLIHYLMQVKPVIRNLSFAFDIGDSEDGWLKLLEGFLKCTRLQDLVFANLNWRETPMKSMWVEHSAWTMNDFMYSHRRRQRLFCSFFDTFATAAPNVRKMILPFDWSGRSFKSLRKLKQLDSLVLEKYFVFQTLTQAAVDDLFNSVPQLRKLILEIWSPSAKGLQMYDITASELELLDVSQSRGFYLKSVNLPKLKEFKIARHSWNGPLTSVDQVDIPCVLEVLRAGAPGLEQLNEHLLHPGWCDAIYPELELILKAVCSCREHKSGWAM
jgi:hypothetical protein